MHNIKRFRYKTGSEFNKVVLVVEQNNYLTKFVNIHIVYDLDNWLRNMLNNLHEKCFLKTTNLVRYSNKSKHVYSGYEMNLMKQFRGVLVKTLL